MHSPSDARTAPTLVMLALDGADWSLLQELDQGGLTPFLSSLVNAGTWAPLDFPLPAGVDATVDPKQTKLSVTGIDRQKVGQVAAEMRSLRPPDPYKNKGVRYAGERLKKKVGKTGAK